MSANNVTPNLPDISIQFVHIEGSRKGEIDELCKSEIIIGRNPSCDVVFPKDLRIVSREHAKISREGNRFHLKNVSKNGCYINGQKVEQAYLKQGDVITLASGGPKISFLTTVKPALSSSPSRPLSQSGQHGDNFKTTPSPSYASDSESNHYSKPTPQVGQSAKVSAPFTIQYGTSIQSYNQASVSFGKDASNDFAINHPRILGKQAEIYFQSNQYFLRDCSAYHATYLNDRPISTDTPLQYDDIITLNEGGPKLKYIGDGRFAEVIEQSSPDFRSGENRSDNDNHSFSSEGSSPSIPKDPSVKDLFKSFFKK